LAIRKFGAELVGVPLIQSNDSCPIISVVAFSDETLKTEWTDPVLTWDDKTFTGHFNTTAIFSPKAIFIGVANQGGFTTTFMVPVAVVPAPVPPSDCTPEDVSLN